MKIKKIVSTLSIFLIGFLLATTMLLTTKVVSAEFPTDSPIASAPTFHYQGRLLDPDTGNLRVDGDYAMSFSIYTIESGGSPLWTESKNVTVSNGIFSTMLGDTTALNLSIFKLSS